MTTKPMTEQRTMPHDLDAEQALLGAILLNNKIYLAVRYFLTPQEFASPAHGVTFKICGKLIERDETADPATVVRIAKQDDSIAEFEVFSDLEDFGFEDFEKYLSSLPKTVSEVEAAKAHAVTIHELFIRRDLIALGEDIVNEAYDKEDQTAMERISFAIRYLMDLEASVKTE